MSGTDAAVEGAMVSLSTGTASLDVATGIGGFQRASISEIVGDVDAAARIAASAAAATQVRGGFVAWLDGRCAFGPLVDPRIDLAKLLVCQPDTRERAFDVISMYARAGVTDLVIVDNVLALPTTEVDERAATIFLRYMRTLTATASRTGTAFLFLCEKPNNALKLYASMRVDARVLESGEVHAKVIKNKFATPFGEATFSTNDRDDEPSELFALLAQFDK